MRKAMVVLGLLASVAAQPAPVPPAGPAQVSDAEEARIARIAGGVSPAFVIEGEPVITPPLAERMAALAVPGVSVAVIEGGAIVWARGWGLADAEAGAPVTAETLFQAASISKPVAAMVALDLVEEGALDLDGPVNAYLTSWRVPANELTERAPVTLRQLVSHTAGTTVHGFGGYAGGANLPDTVGILAGAGNSDAVVVDVEPGSGWRYSGGGYTVVQLAIEDVTGRPFAEVAAQRVLEPLGMADSTFVQPLPDELHGRAAVGYRSDGSPVEGRWHAYPELAAAGLWTTPSDLARWALAVQRGRATGQHPVLSGDLLDEMLAEQATGQGLGPALVNGGLLFGHGGANEGYRSTFRAYVDGDQGAVVMTNSDSGGQLAAEIVFTIAREYGWHGVGPRRMVPIDLLPAQLQPYAGEYVGDEPWRVRFEVVDGRLVGHPAWSDTAYELVPDGPDHFFVRADAAGVRFLREAGEIVAVEVQGFRFRRESG